MTVVVEVKTKIDIVISIGTGGTLLSSPIYGYAYYMQIIIKVSTKMDINNNVKIDTVNMIVVIMGGTLLSSPFSKHAKLVYLI